MHVPKRYWEDWALGIWVSDVRTASHKQWLNRTQTQSLQNVEFPFKVPGVSYTSIRGATCLFRTLLKPLDCRVVDSLYCCVLQPWYLWHTSASHPACLLSLVQWVARKLRQLVKTQVAVAACILCRY